MTADSRHRNQRRSHWIDYVAGTVTILCGLALLAVALWP